MTSIEIIKTNFFSDWFTVSLCFVGVWWILSTSFNKKFTFEKRIEIVTTIGIAFTFFGITLGLLSFQSDDILNSIPNLLNGLSVAFITSFAGVFAALILKHQLKSGNTNDDGLGSQTDNELFVEMAKSLKELNKNLYGEEEGSLIGQLKLSRQEANDHNKKLSDTISEFADKVAKNQTEELISALKIVLEGLEKTIQDKLGESFKEFSKSVDNLVKWQENYKEMVKNNENELKNIRTSLIESKNTLVNSSLAIEKIANSTKIFKENMKELENNLEDMKHGVGSIKDFSKDLGNVSEEIKKNIEDVMEKTLTELGQNLKGISDALVQDYKKVHDLIKSINNNQNT